MRGMRGKDGVKEGNERREEEGRRKKGRRKWGDDGTTLFSLEHGLLNPLKGARPTCLST